MTAKEKHINELVAGFLPDDSFFIVKIEVKGHDGKEKVEVYIDGDNGVSVEICSKVSRMLSEALETSTMFTGSYTLEVSSPGTDFPLQTERQYRKNLGRLLKVKQVDGIVVKGELKEVGASGITLKVDKGKKADSEIQSIVYNQIVKSNVIVTFK